METDYYAARKKQPHVSNMKSLKQKPGVLIVCLSKRLIRWSTMQ